MHTTVTTTYISSAEPLSLDDLARLCGVEHHWIEHIVEIGILQRPSPDNPIDWQFVSHDIVRALEARQLQRAFDANLDAVAMLMDLSHEIRRLKTIIRAHDLDL